MKKILHIIASPREEDSRTLQISKVFFSSLKETHPDWKIDELDLSKIALPSLSKKVAGGKYFLFAGQQPPESVKEWPEIVKQIERFKAADLYVISTPMWNFNVPYMLKHYIDVLVQPTQLFRFTANGGAEGLLKNKKMVVITSRGADYSGDYKVHNHQEPYLRSIFGFVGITDITFVIAQPMDMGLEIQKQRLQEAKIAAKELGKRI